MIKLIVSLISVIGLMSCGAFKAGEIRAGEIPFNGQWTTPVDMGRGIFYTTSMGVDTAMLGANKFCEKNNKKAETDSLIPINQFGRTSLMFKCN